MQRQDHAVVDRIVEFVSRNPGWILEDVVMHCPDLTWNQVFLAVDSLSRCGKIHLKRQGPGLYSLSAPGYEKSVKGREA
jgi:hypothetical protein